MWNDINVGAAELVSKLVDAVFTPLLTLLGLASFVYFIWGVVMFIQSSGKDGASEESQNGKRHMVYGIIGLVVIFGANALVAMIKGIWN